MYQALYRKWRPRSFDDVVGQEHVTGTLKRQIESGRLSHAYLFVGTRGTGKTTCAKILSRAVNCERPIHGNPCNECPSCLGIEDGSVMDVLELDAASNNGVDNVRALREEAVFTPAAVKRRVYIIDEVHMLSTSAFNALLKILEEPPEHLLFILATTELHKVPATILSRCQRFSFKRILPDVIAGRLADIAASEEIRLTQDAAARLARLADGSMRDALSLLDQCASGDVIDIEKVLTTIGLASTGETVRLVSAALSSDARAALAVLDGLYADGKDMQSALSAMAGLIRDVLLMSLAPRGGDKLMSGAYSDETINELSGIAEPERLFYCIDTIRSALADLARGASARLTAELCLLRICDERLSGGEAALLSRISKLEAMFAEPGRVIRREAAPMISAEPERDIPEPDIPEPVPDAPEPEQTVEADVQNQPDEAKETPTDDAPADFWERILELLRDEISVYTLLGDRTQISAELCGGKLIIKAGNPFLVHTIEAKSFVEPIKRAAETALGRPVTVCVTKDDGGEKTAPSELDRLGAFDIVKFE